MKIFRIAFACLLLCCALPGAVQAQERSGSIVTIDGAQYYVHTVQEKETVYGLSRLYNVPEDQLLCTNPHIGGGLKPGQVLKIPVNRDGEKELNRRQMRRTFDTHTVKQGETLYGISRQYGISVNVLLEDNQGLDPVYLPLEFKLNIRKSEQGDTSGWQITEEIEEYRDAINSVTPDGQFYLVKGGDTLYSLAKAFGVSVEEIEAANSLRDGLKAGQLIKIPGESLAVIPAESPGQRFDSRRDSLEYVREQMRGERERPGRRDMIDDISHSRRLNVSLLLPLTNEDGTANKDRNNFIQFYYGVLVGLEDLKQQGVSVNLSVFDTSRSMDKTVGIVNSPEFRSTDLVIGPVYGEGLLPVVAFAEREGIPVVSPLQQHDDVSSPVLYQMAPSQAGKYGKLKTMLSQPGLNIIYVNTAAADTDMDTNLRPALPSGVKQITYSKAGFASALENSLEKRSGDNMIIVSCTSMQTVDQILSHISSVQSNLVARSMMSTKVRVVGNSGWARFPTTSVDHDLYFKLQLCFVTNYHADRVDERVRDFNRRYMENYSVVPSLFSYRGYDAAKLFGGALMARGDDFTWKVNGSNQTLLQMSYHMDQEFRGGDFRNTEWALVCYGTDYIIRME